MICQRSEKKPDVRLASKSFFTSRLKGIYLPLSCEPGIHSMMLKKYAGVLILLFSFSKTFVAYSQYLNNPSFEGTVQLGVPPPFWDSTCNANRKPDTQNGTILGVTLTPSQGSTYLEMVCRGGAFNDSTICEQQLQSPLDTGTCYKLTLDLAYSKSFTDTGAAATSYGQLANLKIWGGTASCSFDTMFWPSSSSVIDTFWKTSVIIIKPSKIYTYLIFDATFDTLPPYFGNILIDNASLTKYSNPTTKLDTTVAKGSHFPITCSSGSSYQWSPPNGLSCANCQSPTVIVDKPVTYGAVITDNSGCTTTEFFEIKLETTIPSVFTPNNDGLNDLFFIQGLPTNAALKIFNRWGQMVFQEDNYANDWKGKTTSGKDLADGVYYYELKSSSGGKAWHGYVQLIR